MPIVQAPTEASMSHGELYSGGDGPLDDLKSFVKNNQRILIALLIVIVLMILFREKLKIFIFISYVCNKKYSFWRKCAVSKENRSS